MLKGIDPLLGPELLATLRAMGHADEIAIVDANFPAAANARRLIRAEGVSATRMVQAILSVLPLEQFEPVAAFRMAVDGAPDELPAVIGEFEALLRGAGYGGPIAALGRFDYYERTRAAYAIVSTGERRYWGNLILKKGAIPPEGSGG
ncbi:MAG TPA: RbsD/FucU domain-containing protein [Caulobacteraceae bacterium]|nr:RbsD/FucU domain-containing protein [Caulobacteraceae bacterium]